MGGMGMGMNPMMMVSAVVNISDSNL